MHGIVEQAPVAGLLTRRGAMSLRGLGGGRNLFACLNVAHRLERTHNISGLLLVSSLNSPWEASTGG